MKLGGWQNFTQLKPEGLSLIHVVPRGDLRMHDLEVDCWCKPEQDLESPEVFIHNAMDRRELYERGELKPQ